MKRREQQLDFSGFRKGASYSRAGIAAVGQVPPLVHSREWNGITEFNNCVLLFVKLVKTGAKDDHRYRDEFRGHEFYWDSQSKNTASTPVIRRLKKRDPQDPVLLFARIKDKVKSKTQPFIYCGKLRHEDSSGEHPVSFRWTLLDFPSGLSGNPDLDALASWSPDMDATSPSSELAAKKCHLYVWNPSKWTWDDFDDAERRVLNKEDYDMYWSCGRTTKKQISIGDMFFLMRLGVAPKGIVGCGYILSEPYYKPHWDPVKAANGEEALRTDVHFTSLSSAPLLELNFLQQQYSYNWTPQMGGTEIPKDICEDILDLIQRDSRYGFEPIEHKTVRIKAERKSQSVSVQQGYGLTSPERKAVELRAMFITKRHLESHGYSVKDTSSRHSFDFLASKDGKDIKVEVKGTTSPRIESVIMTSNEVDLHIKESGKTALAIVSNISLMNRGDKPRCEDGKLEFLYPWDIERWSRKPTQYQVIRPQKITPK